MIGAGGLFKYLDDLWNANDMVMIFLTWLYCSIRLNIFGTEANNECYLLIRDISVTESHIESEVIL